MNAEDAGVPFFEGLGGSPKEPEQPDPLEVISMQLAMLREIQMGMVEVIWASMSADAQNWYLQARSARQQEAAAREKMGLNVPVAITDARKSTVAMATPDGKIREVTNCVVARPKVPEPKKGE